MGVEESMVTAPGGQHTAPSGHRSAPLPPAHSAASLPPAGISRILGLLGAQTTLDFSPYKQCAILRGIDDRIAHHHLQSACGYASYLEGHPGEVQLLFGKLLIRVTRFFRDPEAFARLEAWLPQLVRSRPTHSIIRLWVPACATGEEACSLAILLQERTQECRQPCEFRVIATDIDRDAVEVARQGVYPFSIAQDVSVHRLKRFFTRVTRGYQVNEEIRAKVTFCVRHVAAPLPTKCFDLISCRNLMIYLNPDLQDFLVAAFHRALLPGGGLFLSPSESIGERSDLFTPISRKWKLYQANNFEPAAGYDAAAKR
jgi:two-component system CheB/CheR fusion protein